VALGGRWDQWGDGSSRVQDQAEPIGRERWGLCVPAGSNALLQLAFRGQRSCTRKGVENGVGLRVGSSVVWQAGGRGWECCGEDWV